MKGLVVSERWVKNEFYDNDAQQTSKERVASCSEPRRRKERGISRAVRSRTPGRAHSHGVDGPSCTHDKATGPMAMEIRLCGALIRQRGRQVEHIAAVPASGLPCEPCTFTHPMDPQDRSDPTVDG